MNNKLRIAVRKFEPFELTIHSVWDMFCKKTGCTLELEAVPMDLNPLYKSTLGQEQGLRKGTWDIAHINTDWICEAYKNNAVESLTPWLKKQSPEDYPNGWSDSLLSLQNFDDNIFGLPFHGGPECLIYRKDLFNSPKEKKNFQKLFGRKLEVPKTWEELQNISRFFYRPADNIYGTAFALYPDGHNTVFDFCLQLWSHGGSLLDENGKININTKTAKKALTFYRQILRDDKAVHPECKKFDSVQSGKAFANGEIAIMVNWFGFASMSEVLTNSKVKGKVDVAEIPSGFIGNGLSLNVYWLYAIGKGSKNKQVAYDFISFAVNKSNDKLLTLNGGIGCRKSTWIDKDINEKVPFYHKLNRLHENVGTLPRMRNWNIISHIIDDMVTKLISTNNNISELLSEAQDKIELLK